VGSLRSSEMAHQRSAPASKGVFQSANVVVATGLFQKPKIPADFEIPRALREKALGFARSIPGPGVVLDVTLPICLLQNFLQHFLRELAFGKRADLVHRHIIQETPDCHISFVRVT
jgi:hypothetical protein